MADNTRIFKAHQLSFNGQALGGTSSIAFDTSYRDVVVANQDGAFGVTDIDRALQGIGFTIVTKDVEHVLAILNATPGTADTTWYAERSGTDAAASIQRLYTLPSADCHLVIDSMNLTFPRNDDATFTIGGFFRFIANGTKIEDFLEFVDTATLPAAGSLTQPLRLRYPRSFVFTPTVGPPPAATTIKNVESIQLSLSAGLIRDGAENDFGEIAVDRVGWNALQTTIVTKDQEVGATGGFSKIVEMQDHGRGALTFSAVQAGTVVPEDQVLYDITVNNILWSGLSESQTPNNYSPYTVNGQSSWVSRVTTPSETSYDLSATPLFSIEAA